MHAVSGREYLSYEFPCREYSFHLFVSREYMFVLCFLVGDISVYVFPRQECMFLGVLLICFGQKLCFYVFSGMSMRV